MNYLVNPCRDADQDPEPETTKYPDCYLHVTECRSGQTWIVPLRGNSKLDLKYQIKKWIKSEFASELRLDPPLLRRLDGDYYAKIITDGRPPDTAVVWDSGGFYLKPNYE